jgi:hypothetical protein
MLKYFLIIFLTNLSIFNLPSEIFSQNEWSRIVYYNSNGENYPESKRYYIITVNNDGNGKLEYFNSGKVKEYEFHTGNKSMKNFNSLLIKSGIYNIDPTDIKSDIPLHSNSILNMTIFFEKTKENYLHYNGKEFSEEEIAEKRKEPFLAVPTDYNLYYAEMVNKIYTGLEFLVPDNVWEKAVNGE